MHTHTQQEQHTDRQTDRQTDRDTYTNLMDKGNLKKPGTLANILLV